MKIRCKISGLEFKASSDFQDEAPLPSFHPIFFSSTRSLLARARKVGQGRYSEREEKLLLLALLNTTGKIRWEVPAKPSLATVKRNLEPMFRVVSWWYEVQYQSMQLPELAVTENNQDLSNLSVYIQSWYEVRQEFMSGSSLRLKQQLLEQREIRMSRLIHSTRSTESRASLLASWALDACEVKGEDKRREWTELFKLKVDKNLMQCDLDELTDMRNWMRDKLYSPNGIGTGYASIFAQDVMNHLNELVEARKAGWLGQLGTPESMFRYVDWWTILQRRPRL